MWWKKALYDTCSLITLDKLLLERADLAKHFPNTIIALEESFSVDQLRKETATRMRPRVTFGALPTPLQLAKLLASKNLSKALSQVDRLVYATAVNSKIAIVTGDKGLARAVQSKKIKVGNMALILKELVITKKLTKKDCESLLLGLASRKDFILGIPTPRWTDLQNYSFQ